MRTPQCPIAKSTCSGVNSESPTTSSSFIPTADLNDDILTGLPDDVLFQILLYCGPKEVDETIKLVCRRLHKSTSMSLDLWKIFCSITGKSLAKSHVTVPSKMTNRWIKFCNLKIAGSGNVFRQYYYRNPCVPVDFRNINDAIRYCPRNKSTPFPLEDEERYYSDEGSVVLMPGVYEERITVHGEPFVAGHTIRSITIRAAFPSIGATLVHYDCQRISSSVKNQSAITVSTRSEDDDFDESGICVKLSHLQILHSTPGADIWGGNTAVLLDGLRAQAVVHCCKIQSDSGRGVVVTNQAELQMTHSSIVNCAATGFYLGDRGSKAKISSSNIVECGYGNIVLRELTSEAEREARDEVLNNFVAHALIGQLRRNQVEVVPPGHSGVYIESSMAWIEDSLIAGNSLTGVSVVRSGFLNLSGSDITENGDGDEEQIMVEDIHDVRDQVHLNGAVSIRGGLMEGPLPNNFTSRMDIGNINIVYKGGKIRSVRHSIVEPLRLQDLLH